MSKKVVVVGELADEVNRIFRNREGIEIVPFSSIDWAMQNTQRLSSAVSESTVLVVDPYKDEVRTKRELFRKTAPNEIIVDPGYNHFENFVKGINHDFFFAVLIDRLKGGDISQTTRVPNTIATRYHSIEHFGALEHLTKLDTSSPKLLVIYDTDYYNLESDCSIDFQARKLQLVVKEGGTPSSWARVEVLRLKPNKEYEIDDGDGLRVVKRYNLRKYKGPDYWVSPTSPNSEARKDYKRITTPQTYGDFKLEFRIETPQQLTKATQIVLYNFKNFSTGVYNLKK